MLCSFLFPPTLLQAAWRMDYELANVAAAAKPATQPAVTSSPERTPAVPGDFVLDQRDRAGDFVLGRRGGWVVDLGRFPSGEWPISFGGPLAQNSRMHLAPQSRCRPPVLHSTVFSKYGLVRRLLSVHSLLEAVVPPERRSLIFGWHWVPSDGSIPSSQANNLWLNAWHSAGSASARG